MRKFMSFAAILVFASAVSAQIPEQEKDIIVQKTNEFRKSQGKNPFQISFHLSEIAQKHCDNLARLDKIGDNGNPHFLFGKGPDDRVKEGKYFHAGLAEIINLDGDSHQLGERAVNSWISSEDHKKIILSDFTVVGVGLAKSKAGRWFSAQLLTNPK